MVFMRVSIETRIKRVCTNQGRSYARSDAGAVLRVTILGFAWFLCARNAHNSCLYEAGGDLCEILYFTARDLGGTYARSLGGTYA